MVSSDLVSAFIEDNVYNEFHLKKEKKIKALRLVDITKRKNPYLFRAKGIDNASDLIRSIMEATVSSGEETVFGNFMEKVAIYTCQKAFNGRKSSARGIDLEFEHGSVKYMVSIKSGPYWGNSSQKSRMKDNFLFAKKVLGISGGLTSQQVVFVEGCCYGSDAKPDKASHIRLCGEDFWSFISGGNQFLYQDIIEPFGHKARERCELLNEMIDSKLNLFTAEFVNLYCDESGRIDWEKLIFENSGTRSNNHYSW
ncbi:hypothetical protein BZG04_00585 [Salinivibrio kushneri]|uniref:PmeII family type II restriction endonuclease n=1 Tax=Salinivibrio kushneri TaxID=1908198 RepID=UPI0009889E19|nr:PmeII family type II restriction endonuclease [Salinivibrio kushneri]OOE38210.1 hypothetical protein BZG04_00585 [Salinivibrio kushneri]